jgi:hypothetical protein
MALITPQAFFVQWNNKGADFDKAYGNQCFDVLQYYNRDVIGGTFIPGATALDVWNNETYDKNLYKKILNSTNPENKPKTGDIIFFSFNHVAIVVTADDFDIISFDQNFPSQGYYDSHGNFIGTGICHFQTHSYGSPVNVVGWLTPINPV